MTIREQSSPVFLFLFYIFHSWPYYILLHLNTLLERDFYDTKHHRRLYTIIPHVI